jgi:hypothetical protein
VVLLARAAAIGVRKDLSRRRIAGRGSVPVEVVIDRDHRRMIRS